MTNQLSRDLIAGSCVLVTGIALLAAIPSQIVTYEDDTLTPAFIPLATGWTIVVFATYLVAKSLWQLRVGSTGAGPAVEQTGSLVRMGLTAAVTVAYVTLIPTIGYLLATGVALVGLALLYGHRSWWQIALLAVLTPPAVFYFFRYAMLVLLPQGAVFE